MVKLVVDGEVLEEKVHQEAMEEDELRPADLDLVLGGIGSTEETGMASHLNMFTSPLSTAAMVALTAAGGEECGPPGTMSAGRRRTGS